MQAMGKVTDASNARATNWRGEARVEVDFIFAHPNIAGVQSYHNSGGMILRSPGAIKVNIEIMRAFVRLRQMLASNAELSRKLVALEKKYDAQFKIVFDAIRKLMAPPEPKRRQIGFCKRKD